MNEQIPMDASHIRALRMLSSCNEALIRATDEKGLLKEICRLAVETGGYFMAWVGYARNDVGKTVEPMAHAGKEAGYLSEIAISWDESNECGHGPAGKCIRSGQAIVYRDISDKSASFIWRDVAAHYGYGGVICLPLIHDGLTFGILSLHSAAPHTAGSEEIQLLQQLADDLAFGISIMRSRLQSQIIQEIVIKVAQAVSTSTGKQFFNLLTRHMVEALGAEIGFIGHVNDARDRTETICFMIDGEMQPSREFSLKGTPCEEVMAGDCCVFPRNVQELFPNYTIFVDLQITGYAGVTLRGQDGNVMGLMAVLFRQPVEEPSLVESTLKIFAARVAAELDRQEADERIRAQASLLDKARDAIVVRSLDHNITYWNKSAERLSGWSAEEAVGRKVTDLLYKNDSTYLEAFEKLLLHGEWQGELQQINKQGQVLIVEGRWTLVHDAEGNPKSIFAINTDITEHRELEQQFIRAQRLESIGTMAGGLAHDLNNILAPISMAVELLKMRATDSRSQEILDTIAGSARRGAEMIEQVISFARGIEGRRVEVHPKQLIEEIAKIGRDTFLKAIDLTVQTDPGLWVVEGDQTQLHQVLLNLSINARDALFPGGRIIIRASNISLDGAYAAMNLDATAGPHVCIEIEDNGMGIDPAAMDKIFDPFYTTKAVGKGTGLGLSTSLAIIKSHGGFFRVESTVGKGSCFRIYLPARVATHVEIPTIQHDGQGRTVLVVDDEPSIRQIMRQTLETYGYRTLLAQNGDEAVSLYAEYQREIDIVITDIMMPVMDGSATIDLLMRINPDIKIIAASGITTQAAKALSISGVKRFLAKPYTAESLLKALTEVLGNGT